MPNNPLRCLIACLILLSACTPPPATPISLVSPTGASTAVHVQRTATVAAPADTPTPTPTQPAPPTDANLIPYYRFVRAGTQPPERSVVIAPDVCILAPALLDTASTADVASDLRLALKAAISHPDNLWAGDKLTIGSLTFDAGHADVQLQGDIFAVGDVLLIAARMQLLLTIFANPAVQSARVTFRGDTIGNWGVSNSMSARPADYVFRRMDIESYIVQNAYRLP